MNINFDDIFKIMDASFPECEMRTYEGQRSLLNIDNYKIETTEKDNKIVGFIAYWDIGDLIFGEHLAIDADYRQHGIGKELISQVMKKCGKPFILEVEPPETEIAKRRIGFYQRLGFIYNDYEYFQPPLRKGMPLTPLKVMSYPDSISKDELDKIIKLLNENVYNNI